MFFSVCVSGKFMSSVVSCTSEYVTIKHFNLRILSIETKTQDLN